MQVLNPHNIHQRRSHLFLVGAAENERRRRKCERGRREAILGGYGGMPHRNFFSQMVPFCAIWDDFKQ